MLPPYFTNCSRSLPLRVQPVYSSTITCAFRRSLLKCLFGAKLQDVFTAGLPRASHLPAAFCAYLPAATCSYHSLLTYKITCIINTAHLLCQVLSLDFSSAFHYTQILLNFSRKTCSTDVSCKTSKYSSELYIAGLCLSTTFHNFHNLPMIS